MFHKTMRKELCFSVLGAAILGLAAFGCGRTDRTADERQSQRQQQEPDQGAAGGMSRQSPQSEYSPESARGPSSQQTDLGQSQSGESSIEGTVVKVDRENKEIVVDTNEGPKTVQIENNTEGVEKATEGARVTIQVSGSGSRLKAEKIQVSMAEPAMPRG